MKLQKEKYQEDVLILFTCFLVKYLYEITKRKIPRRCFNIIHLFLGKIFI